VALEKVGVQAVIEGLNPYLAGINKMNSATAGLGTSIQRGLQRATMLATVGIVAAGAAATGFAIKGLKMADTIEQAKLAFETLLGSADAAGKRIKELSDFAARTPFELPGIIEADRLLTTFGARSIENLTLVGDAAAGVGVGIEEIAFWFGRAYTAIQSGRPFGEALMRLQELGLVTGEARNQLEDMQAAGAPAAEVFGVLTDQLGRFNGLMEKQSQTLGGLMSTISDNFNLALAALVQPFLPELKKGLGAAIEYLDDHQRDIEDFGQAMSDALGRDIPQAIRIVTPAIEDLRTDFEWFIQNKPALVTAIAAIGVAFAWANPVEGALAAVAGAFVIFRGQVEDLPGPLQRLQYILKGLAAGILELAQGFLVAAEKISDFGNWVGVIGDDVENQVDEALAEVDRLRMGLLADMDDMDRMWAAQSAIRVENATAMQAELARNFGVVTGPTVEPISQDVERLLRNTGAAARQAAPEIANYGSAAGGAAEKTEKLVDPLEALADALDAIVAPANAVFSALDKLLGLPSRESAEADVRLAELKLQLLDEEAAAEEGKLRREKQIADLQGRLNGIQGKGNDLLEKKLQDQIEALQGGQSPEEKALDATQKQIDLLEHDKDRRAAVRDLDRARAIAADQSLLSEQQILDTVDTLIATIPGITTEQLANITAAQVWMGVNEQIASQYAAMWIQLKDIAAIQAVIGGAPTGKTESGWAFVKGQWVYTPGFQYGGVVPGPIGRPIMAMVHGGEMILPPGNLALNMPMTLNMAQNADWAMMVRAAHVALDTALGDARTQSFKGGNSLGSGIG
jgi:hypothetical protein